MLIAAYLASVAVLLVTRYGLGWSNEGQVTVALVVLLGMLVGAVLIDRRWAGRRRTGWQAVANAAIVLIAFIVSEVLHQARPDDYPLFLIGLVVPVFLVAEAVVDLRGSS